MYYFKTVRDGHNEKLKMISVAGLLCLVIFISGQDGGGSLWQREIVKAGYEKMVTFCMPFFSYFAKETETMSIEERMISYFFPVIKQGRRTLSYRTESESAFSYEMILALEAADEDYIETALQGMGETVGENSAGVTGGEVIWKENPVEEYGYQDNIVQESIISGSMGAGGEKAVVYSMEKLADFDYLIQNFYRVDKTTTINSSQLNVKEMLEKNMTLSHDATSPQILIYHTHASEGYKDSVEGDLSTTVVGVGEYLTTLLQEKYGLNVIHHKGAYDVVSRDNAYSDAGPALKKILEENPSIEVVIDLHRDGVAEDTRLVTTIDGVEMAKIMFVNGLSRTTGVGDISYLYNPNLADNLAFSFQTQLAAAEYYPGLSRGVYLKGYRYNMHYCPKTLLLEVGAQNNTLEEAKNAMVLFADILYKVVSDEEKTN